MSETADVVLIGGGVMSATLGAMLSRLEPTWTIHIYESGPKLALESSGPWRNAGTGHSGLCELNYMPEGPHGELDGTKATTINAQFQLSREFWSTLVREATLPEPHTFINSVPHMTFVRGDADVDYLRRRFEILRTRPLFAEMEHTTDTAQIAEWAPLLTQERGAEPIAATRSTAGTDVDFGRLTEALVTDIEHRGGVVRTNAKIVGLRRPQHGPWSVTVRAAGEATRSVSARFVFVGAGGASLSLLQQSGIPEIRGYGGFPISGLFLKTTAPAIVEQHHAKVYGKAAVGAPPMSVPHLDTRVVNGQRSLLFGPYAGFSPKFLIGGRVTDLPGSIRGHNLGPLLSVAAGNPGLLKYLVGEILASRRKRDGALRDFVPNLQADDWELITAGQRVQVIKPDSRGRGSLQFGTEVVVGGNGSIAGLLGASPGASTAVAIMLDLLRRCFPGRWDGWQPTLDALIPSHRHDLTTDPARAEASIATTADTLKLTQVRHRNGRTAP
ncbi:malate dehydrogenase (quinone) [Curtobacterium sp. MCBA15_001]|uniref:malate dehydrogenase (quinone) n=1 Tax=Curtobacterium sp. MCBA15_001 TaxID=1898731 RepID=UPI000B03D5BE|nr:malate dehydrogenase (quinone) [Curtobacterium sp. MCBA15_001]